MRAHEGTARRYAKALFLAAREAGTTATVLDEIVTLQAVIHEYPDVRDVLARPWIKATVRRDVAAAIAEQSGASQLVRKFAGLIAERGRTDHLGEIVSAYRALVDDDLGQARAQVRAAVALTDDDKRRLAARLEHVLGKRIIVEERVDHALLGGFVAQVGGLILDGSLDGQLARMRERLARG